MPGTTLDSGIGPRTAQVLMGKQTGNQLPNGEINECYDKGYPEVLRRYTEDAPNPGGWGRGRVFSGGNVAS